jgi:hypothetical protein
MPDVLVDGLGHSTEATDAVRRDAASVMENAEGANSMNAASTETWTETWTELASRSSDGLDVTLVWTNRGGADEVVVRVADFREGDYFEIPAEPARALEVYYHPFAYQAIAHR